MLVVIMMLSAMSVALISVSAAETENVTCNLEVHTAGSDGRAYNVISIKINGDKGSTGWHSMGNSTGSKTGNLSFSDKNVGTVKSFTVKNSKSNDPWFPEYINITK